jgi:hypothetical protein
MNFLQDLDYTYSTAGKLSKYILALVFPPWYFRHVIPPGSTSSDPTMHLDLSSWEQKIAASLQLLQDRLWMET